MALTDEATDKINEMTISRALPRRPSFKGDRPDRPAFLDRDGDD
jgi:hypothetical protein